jgi:3'-phosphoadenosine 5'-phosphosulfate sulfotransferase
MKVNIIFTQAKTNERDLLFESITEVRIDSTSIVIKKDGIANLVYDGSTINNEIVITEDKADDEEKED